MAIISTEAIVLRSIDHRETSKIAFFFTRKNGKVTGVLKGIRKDPRKFGSGLEKFSVNDIVYYEYRNSDIHLVSACDMKEFFGGIRQESRRITAADYGAELVNRIMPAEEPNPGVFTLLLDYLRALDRERSGHDIDRLVHMFQIKFLALSGFRPHIDSCVICGKGIGDRARFSLRRGGLVCGPCQGRDTALLPVSKGAIATLLYVEKEPWSGCLKLRMPPSIRMEMRRILNSFLLFHLEKNIRSAKYLF
ncbi:MAG: DNA repair protein RecO [Candidatus Omnitrophica bacterium]|nr:DNA repair protein RecO [Candidatus Omnitrophota bacterium]